VVGTLMSNLGMEVALRELGIPFARAKVGDRYVLEMMEQKGWRLGGESSGHIICRDVTTTGDGIVSALRVLAAMSARGREPARAAQPGDQVPADDDQRARGSARPTRRQRHDRRRRCARGGAPSASEVACCCVPRAPSR
jgi:phosphomannomutase